MALSLLSKTCRNESSSTFQSLVKEKHDMERKNILFRSAEIGKDEKRIAQLWHDVYHESHAHLVAPELLQFRTVESFGIRASEARFIKETIVAIEMNDEKDTQHENLLGFITTRVETFEIYQLFVAKEVRGLGIAKELMIRAENFFKSFQNNEKAGFSEKNIKTDLTIHLYASVGNVFAKGFYEKLGYEVANEEMFQAEIVVEEDKNIRNDINFCNKPFQICHFPVHCYRFEKKLG